MKIQEVVETPMTQEKDPVCGMTVDPATAIHADVSGHRYHFCSASCRAKFVNDPAAYLEPASEAAPAGDSQATYTCPMHPEVRQTGPGACPKCGMALKEKHSGRSY